jgi:hypothetical protein
VFDDDGNRALDWCEIGHFDDKAEALKYGAEVARQRNSENISKWQQEQEAKKAAAERGGFRLNIIKWNRSAV